METNAEREAYVTEEDRADLLLTSDNSCASGITVTSKLEATPKESLLDQRSSTGIRKHQVPRCSHRICTSLHVPFPVG
jgi:hypothetical protein